ncbi:MAG: peptide chain release factor H [Planctomycetota bacterium]
MSLWLQVTSGQGPAECQWAAARVVEQIERECSRRGLACRRLEVIDGERDETIKSALVSIEGNGAEGLAESWRGTIQWIGESPYRPNHRRKNWFVGVQLFAPPESPEWSAAEIKVDVMRASGPGGQHVNKTSSAVRITHLPTGLTAIAQEERSQHQNRRLALARLAQLFDERNRRAEATSLHERRQQHTTLERGNPVRVYRGERFRLVKSPDGP